MRSGFALLGCIALTACTGAGALFGGADADPARTSDPDVSATSALDTRSLGVYLETMQALIDGDPVLQAEVFENAAMAAEVAPTTTNRLRLALGLATPGHPAADAPAAQRLLADLLAAGDTLLPEERILATIHLQEVEERLILDTAARQESELNAAELARLTTDTAERLEAAQLENQRLRDELTDAQQKLDAITSIERSIRDRDGATSLP
jgi:hypothetical protein